jgi:Flp pilus assembly protein TadD
MNHLLFTAIAVALVAALQMSSSFAAGDDSYAPAGAPSDPDVEAGRAALRSQDWKSAISAFHKVAAKNPQNADAQNWLGFSYRKSGDLNMAFKHYNEALRLDPKHRGAHEYIGEAYLMKGDLAKAKEHLATLDRLCFFGCEEYSDLKKSIAEYEKKGKR